MPPRECRSNIRHLFQQPEDLLNGHFHYPLNRAYNPPKNRRLSERSELRLVKWAFRSRRVLQPASNPPISRNRFDKNWPRYFFPKHIPAMRQNGSYAGYNFFAFKLVVCPIFTPATSVMELSFPVGKIPIFNPTSRTRRRSFFLGRNHQNNV